MAARAGDDRAMATTLAGPWPGDAQLDEAAAENGIDQAALGAGDRFRQRPIADAFAAREAGEPSRLEDPYFSPMLGTIAQSMTDFKRELTCG